MVSSGLTRRCRSAGDIKRPEGWLNRDIQECWKPNEPIQQEGEGVSENMFGQWFDWARAKGLVVASMRAEDGKIYVFDQEGVRYPFEQMVVEHSIGSLLD